MTGRRELWDVGRFSAPLRVVLELPGADPERVRIVASGSALVISAVREQPHPAGARYHQVEIEYGPFERRIALTEEVDPDSVGAEYEAGMLRLEVPLVTH